MAANIQSMFYHGAKPWHQMGTKVDNLLTSEQAIIEAGLNWEVEKFEVPNPLTGSGTGYYGTYRKDNGHVFKVGFKHGYSIIQNKDGFKFADDLVQNAGARYETAGSLGKGEKIWCLAKLPETVRILGTDDISELYLLFANSHDGSMTAKAALTSVRVVCQNTLVSGLSQAISKVSIFHKSGAMLKMDDYRQRLNIINQQIHSENHIANKLAGEIISNMQIKGILDALIPQKNDEESKVNEIWKDQIQDIFADNDGNAFPKLAGTKWSFLNSITKWCDWVKAPHANSSLVNVDKKHESLLFGHDADFKVKAIELITKSKKYLKKASF